MVHGSVLRRSVRWLAAVLFEVEKGRLLRLRKGLPLLPAKPENVAPEIALAVDLDEAGGRS